MITDQAKFMNAGGQTVTRFNPPQSKLYRDLVREESKEFIETTDHVDAIKEAVDVIVVAIGYLISTVGVEGAAAAWDAVHANNMLKVAAKVEKREDGKVIVSQQRKAELKQLVRDDLYRIWEQAIQFDPAKHGSVTDSDPLGR